MILCAAGDIHGALDRMYEDVLAFEAGDKSVDQLLVETGSAGSHGREVAQQSLPTPSPT